MTRLSSAQAVWRSVLLAAVATAGLFLAGPTRVVAADPQYVGFLAMLEERDVAEQLGLSDKQKQDVIKLIDARELEALNFRDLDGEDKEEAITGLRMRAERDGLRILTQEQLAKLKEIRAARLAAAATGTQDDGPAVGAGDGEDAARDAARDAAEADAPPTDAPPTDVTQSIEIGEDGKPKVVTRETTAEGAAGKADDDRDGPELPPGVEPRDVEPREVEGDQRMPADDRDDRSSGELQPPTRGAERSPDRGPPSRFSPNGSTRGSTPGAAAAAPAAAREPIPVEPLDPEGKIRFKVRYQPWDAVLDWFARAAGYNLIMENPPSGTFNYTSSKAYTPAEAIDLLNSVLLTKGMVLVRNEDLLMLVRTDEVPSMLVQYVPEDKLDDRGEYELVRTIFALERSTPDEIDAEIRPMLGAQGSIIKLAKAKQVQVVETAGRLRAIRKVIQGIENPPPSSDDKLNLIELKHVGADQVIPPIQQHFQMAAGTMQTPDGSLRLLLEPVSGRLFASGTQEQRNKLAELIKVLDVDIPSGGDDVLETPQFVVYPITVADSQAVLAVLQTILAGQPDVRLSVDAKTGHINALARPSQHATIKGIIDEMQSDGRDIEVVHLRYVDPDLAVLMIAKLYATEANPANAPIVDADPLNSRLVIRGTKAQIQQITQLLEKMGETATGEEATLLASGKGPIRTIPLSRRQAEGILDEIEPFWNLNRTNKIRIITPAAADRGLPPPASRQRDSLDDLESRLRDEFLPEDAGATQPALEPRTIRKYRSGDEFAPPAAPPRAESRDGDRAEPLRETRDLLRGSPPVDRSTRSTRWGAPMDRVRIVNHLAPRAQASTRGVAEVRRPSGGQLRYVSQQVDDRQGATAAAAQESQPQPQPKAATNNSATNPAGGDAATSVKGAEIIVKITPGGLVIASEDLEALDAFEDLVNQLADTSTAGGREFTVFYLQYIKAEHAAQILESVMQGGGDDGGGGGGSLFGDLAGAALGGGGGLLGGLLGGGGGGGDLFGDSTSLQIVADPRQNSLIVQGSSADIDTVEQLLQVLDRPGAGPVEKRLQDEPRFIPVYNNPASEIAETVKLVYADRINVGGNQQAQQQRQPSPEEFIRMLRGGGRGGRGGGGGGGGGEGIDRSDVEKVSINVDTRSNSIIVIAPDYLYRDIESLVHTLDQLSAASQQTTEVLTLKGTNAQVIQQYLAGQFGDKIVTSSSTTTRPSTSTPSTSTTPGASGAPGAAPATPQIPSFGPQQGFQIPGQGIPFGGGFGGRGFGDAGGGSRGGDRGGFGGRGGGGSGRGGSRRGR